MVGAFNDRKVFAFNRFFECYHDLLLLKVNQLIDNRPDAEDLVNDIFLIMWKGDMKFETVRNIERYLARTANSVCRDHLEREKTPVINMNGLQIHLQKMEDEAIEVVETKRTAMTLIGMALNMLPAHCKNIFILSRVRGLRNREIAALLNLSEKTVENQINIAMNKLRQQCRKDGIEMYYVSLLIPILWNQVGGN